MTGNNVIYDFILNNIQKIVVPEELIKLELSLSRFELVALLLADRHQVVTMTNLAHGLAIPMSTATGIVDRLVKKGYLKRDRTEEDRRVVAVSLTDDGAQLVQKVKAYFYDFMNRVRLLLTEEELEVSLGIMRKVVTGLAQPGDNNSESAPERKRIDIE